VGLVELQLTNFRVFESRHVTPPADAVTVFLSPNGTGKTSILEAVFALATGGSFRTTSASDLLRTGSDAAAVHGLAFQGTRRLDMKLQLKRGARNVTKRLTINEQRPQTYAEIYDVFPVTIFTPEGVDMVRREPSGRRDFLTRLIVNLDPRTSDVVDRFERVLRQRNALLKSLSGELPTAMQRDELDIWTSEFVEVGEMLVAAREKVLTPLAELTASYYEEIAGGSGDVGLAYERSWSGELAPSLEAAFRDDRYRGHTTLGPHRDDIRITLDQRDARRQASQGEQRSVALSMLLAGDALVRRERDISPLLMLDDVFSELDPVRCSRLLHLLPSGQTLVTTASPLPQELLPAVIIDLSKGE
jgi:DNA replication and repair protein RecF